MSSVVYFFGCSIVWLKISKLIKHQKLQLGQNFATRIVPVVRFSHKYISTTCMGMCAVQGVVLRLSNLEQGVQITEIFARTGYKILQYLQIV